MVIKRRKHPCSYILLVVCLLLIVAGGSLFYLLRTGGGQSKIAGKEITPAVSPTIQSLTATAQHEPLFFDDFTNINKGWSISNISGYTRKIEHGGLTLADQNHKTLTESLPTTLMFNDFVVTVTVSLVQAGEGDSVGLYLRGDSNLDHDYRIDLYGNNTYAISKEFLDANGSPQTTFLVKPTLTTALRPIGKANTITVMMKGPQMALRINSVMVATASDADYTSGQLALFVQNSATSAGVEAVFSRIAVYPVPYSLPVG